MSITFNVADREVRDDGAVWIVCVDGTPEVNLSNHNAWRLMGHVVPDAPFDYCGCVPTGRLPELIDRLKEQRDQQLARLQDDPFDSDAHYQQARYGQLLEVANEALRRNAMVSWA